MFNNDKCSWICQYTRYFLLGKIYFLFQNDQCASIVMWLWRWPQNLQEPLKEPELLESSKKESCFCFDQTFPTSPPTHPRVHSETRTRTTENCMPEMCVVDVWPMTFTAIYHLCHFYKVCFSKLYIRHAFFHTASPLHYGSVLLSRQKKLNGSVSCSNMKSLLL